MAHYEIVAHVTRDLDCETAEEAAALVRRRLLSESEPGVNLLHLAVWRQDPAPNVSPLPRRLRQKLLDFFGDLERCAQEAEEAFRGRVEAILMAPAPDEGRDSGGARP